MTKKLLRDKKFFEHQSNTFQQRFISSLDSFGKIAVDEVRRMRSRGTGKVPSRDRLPDQVWLDLEGEAVALQSDPQIQNQLNASRNPEAYFRMTVRRFLGKKVNSAVKEQRKFPLQDKDFSLDNISESGDSNVFIGRSRKPKYHTRRTSKIIQWEDFPEDFRRRLELSLEFVFRIYKARNYLKNPQNIESKLLRLARLVGKTKLKARRILGSHIEKKNVRYSELREMRNNNRLFGDERKEFEKILSQNKDIWAFDKIEQLERDFLVANVGTVMDFFDPVFLLIEAIPPTKGHILSPFLFADLNIGPGRMLFDIWRKLNELKKGMRLDLKKMKFLFLYLKKKYEKTDWAFLFDSINGADDIQKNLRLYQYRICSEKRLYTRIIKSIYEIIFIEQMDITKPPAIMSWIQLNQGIKATDCAILKQYLPRQYEKLLKREA